MIPCLLQKGLMKTQLYLLRGARYRCPLRGSVRALQIQMRMLAAKRWTEQGDPNGGVREKSEGAEGVCNTIRRTTVSTNQRPPELPGSKVVHVEGPMTRARELEAVEQNK
ncbi:similar to LRRGT00152 (predicted) [Rattus norvegicus]|uniref:Similar to LRRGT00152 (Predicted) n=1 Tax=Rattus norvegicus TaxID=10116 RepID=A6HU16_RAT|nr:similar to LRRGT00152 (predicted) [Rattus norvegicus]